MQDLDFEELDKAVNSLMPQTEAEDTTATPAAPTDPIVPEPTVQPAAKPVINTAPRPSVGRFMDVVHPSSDMRTTLKTPQRPAAPTPTPVPAAPAAPAKPTYTPPVQPTVNASDNWAGLPNYQSPNPVPESPFLPEAKVEKRPLGAFSNELPPEPAKSVPATTESAAVTSDEKPVENVEPANDGNKVPEELGSAMMGVESDSSTRPYNPAFNVNPLSQTPGSTSINQQYTEKPSSNTPQTNPIYDTSSYYKAVTKKKKKKSGWLWVLWIFILLIVGVGAGVAFYYFVMPNLNNFKLPF